MWKVDQIKKTFFPHEVEVILEMPLSPRMPEDSLIWAWSKNGEFTMRSAYKVALKVLKMHAWLKKVENAQIKGRWQDYGSWFGSLNARIKLSISYGGRVRT